MYSYSLSLLLCLSVFLIAFFRVNNPCEVNRFPPAPTSFRCWSLWGRGSTWITMWNFPSINNLAAQVHSRRPRWQILYINFLQHESNQEVSEYHFIPLIWYWRRYTLPVMGYVLFLSPCSLRVLRLTSRHCNACSSDLDGLLIL